MFLGIDITDIGQIGAVEERITKAIDVGMVQSLARRDDLDELVARYGQVIVDECHHVSVVSFERVVAAAKARYVVGLTATPKRRGGYHPIVEMQLGPVRFAVDAKSQASRRPFEHRLFARETRFKSPTADAKIQELYARLAQDDARNRLIVNDVIAAIEARAAFTDPADRAHRSPRILRLKSWRVSSATSSCSRVA